MIIDLSTVTPIALLVLRIIVAVVFLSSGGSHVKNPKERGKEIGMSSTSTFILGMVEIIGALSVAFGIWIQIGAALLILAMLGAISKKYLYGIQASSPMKASVGTTTFCCCVLTSSS